MSGMRTGSLVVPAFVALTATVACGSGGASPGAATGGDASTSTDAPSASDGAAADAAAGDDASSAADSAAGVGLSSKYPCDQGMKGDPAVVWMEDFEEGAVSAVTSRYDSANDPPGMQLVADVPAKSCGKASMKLTSGGANPATDLYKSLPNADEWFVRWYARYDPGVPWHHTGVWIGGYDPPIPYPDPQAGLEPSGDDRFSVSIEPVWNVGQADVRFDTYDYWMQMHSWMDQPSGNTAYYGNSLVHRQSFTVDPGSWVCIEVHVTMNTDPSSAQGAVLEIWKNDALVQRFDPSGPPGYWVKDKFCPQGADGPECTQYPPSPGTTMAPVDLQWRSTTALALNAFWPQNYITDPTTGSVEFDDMVVATARVGCLVK